MIHIHTIHFQCTKTKDVPKGRADGARAPPLTVVGPRRPKQPPTGWSDGDVGPRRLM